MLYAFGKPNGRRGNYMGIRAMVLQVVRMPYMNMECLAERVKPLGAIYSLKPKCLTMRHALTFLFKKGCCDTIFGLSYH